MTCIICGIAARIVLGVWAPPNMRVQGVEQAVILAPFFGVGWLLLSVPVIRETYAPGEPTRHNVVGCLLAAVGAAACLWMVVSVLAE